MRKDSADFLTNMLTRTSTEEDEFILACIEEKHAGVRKDSISPKLLSRAISNRIVNVFPKGRYATEQVGIGLLDNAYKYANKTKQQLKRLSISLADKELSNSLLEKARKYEGIRGAYRNAHSELGRALYKYYG